MAATPATSARPGCSSRPTGAWTALPDLPHARSKPSAVAIGGKLYVLGGWGADDGTVASVDVFDPASGTWSTLAGAVNPAPAAAAGTAVAGGKVYLVGGCVDTHLHGVRTRLVVFDPATGTFRTGAAYPHPVSWLSCGGIGAQVYCAGGIGGDEYTDAWRYDPACGRVEPAAEPPARPVGLPVRVGRRHAGAGRRGDRRLDVGDQPDGRLRPGGRGLAEPAKRPVRQVPGCRRLRGVQDRWFAQSSFVGSAESERLGGLERCAGRQDLPWLPPHRAPSRWRRARPETVTVTLTATAAAGVDQPGTYSGELGITSDTPYPVSSVAVEMNVSPPTSWGKIQGTVTGVTCGGDDRRRPGDGPGEPGRRDYRLHAHRRRPGPVRVVAAEGPVRRDRGEGQLGAAGPAGRRSRRASSARSTSGWPRRRPVRAHGHPASDRIAAPNPGGRRPRPGRRPPPHPPTAPPSGRRPP